MRLLVSALFFSVLSMPSIGYAQVDIFTYKHWLNGGLRMKDNVQLKLSGLYMMWTNGKLS